jgi:hypothetical protein
MYGAQALAINSWYKNKEKKRKEENKLVTLLRK